MVCGGAEGKAERVLVIWEREFWREAGRKVGPVPRWELFSGWWMIGERGGDGVGDVGSMVVAVSSASFAGSSSFSLGYCVEGTVVDCVD